MSGVGNASTSLAFAGIAVVLARSAGQAAESMLAASDGDHHRRPAGRLPPC
jgi:hypothetical protein